MKLDSLDNQRIKKLLVSEMNRVERNTKIFEREYTLHRNLNAETTEIETDIKEVIKDLQNDFLFLKSIYEKLES